MRMVSNFIEVSLRNSNQLLNEIHHYIRWQAPLDTEYMSKDNILKVSCEAMRITVRLTQIIGWFMLQQAILEGTITREEVRANSHHMLQGKTCLDARSESDPLIPYRMRELLKTSRELYVHTMNLEEISLKALPLPEKIRKRSGPHSISISKKA